MANMNEYNNDFEDFLTTMDPLESSWDQVPQASSMAAIQQPVGATQLHDAERVQMQQPPSALQMRQGPRVVQMQQHPRMDYSQTSPHQEPLVQSHRTRMLRTVEIVSPDRFHEMVLDYEVLKER